MHNIIMNINITELHRLANREAPYRMLSEVESQSRQVLRSISAFSIVPQITMMTHNQIHLE